MTPRRTNDADDTGVLQRGPHAAWKLLALIGAILSAALIVVGVDHTLAVAAAQGVVAPVEKRLDDHLSSSRAMREVMDGYVREERAFRRTMSKKMDALCRANPKADCPLGEVD